MDKTIHYPNKIRSNLVTILSMASFTPKSTSKLKSTLHFRYLIVIPCFIPYRYTIFKILSSILITIITVVFITLTTISVLAVTIYSTQ